MGIDSIAYNITVNYSTVHFKTKKVNNSYTVAVYGVKFTGIKLYL